MNTSQSLKDEGNRLFSARKFAEASEKYTAAISAEGGSTNAVLYSNRAACRLNLKQYLDALTDAKKATVLDESYVKAWARRATAYDKLGEPWHSAEAWKKAIELISQENVSEAQTKQLTEYKALLNAAQATLMPQNDREHPANTFEADESELPWEAAANVIPTLQADGVNNSSVWVIHEANEAFELAERILATGRIEGNDLVITPSANARGSMLEAYMDALLLDRRVFRILDQDWFHRYNARSLVECQKSGAWRDGGPEDIIAKVKAKQARDGFFATRKALSLTLRSYLMRSLIESGMRQNYVLCIEIIRRIMDIIAWAQEEWKDIPDEERGREFSPEFHRQLQAVLLENVENLPTTDEYLSDIKALAEETLAMTEESNFPDLNEVENPGFALATNHYIRGRALATLGLWNNLMGNRETDQDKTYEYFKAAARAYKDSADCYPDDDECCASYRAISLENLYVAGPTQATEFLEIMDAISLSCAKMKQVWNTSSMAVGGRDDRIQKQLEAGGHIYARYINGTLKDAGIISLRAS